MPLFFCSRAVARAEEENCLSAEAALHKVGLASRRDDLAGDLSYGQQKLLTFACCLASGADLFLLDEPFAGVSTGTIECLQSLIRDLPHQGKSAFIVEHNLSAAFPICDRAICLNEGSVICEGTPDEVHSDPRVIQAYLI